MENIYNTNLMKYAKRRENINTNLYKVVLEGTEYQGKYFFSLLIVGFSLTEQTTIMVYLILYIYIKNRY